MARKQVRLTFPEEAIREPIIYNLSQQFNVMTNIRTADISEDKGWAVVELEGEEKAIEEGIAWVTTKGVKVDFVGEDF
jgi:ABC-type methionine transport system ATPase subunit